MKKTRNIVFLDVEGVLNNLHDAEVHYEKTKDQSLVYEGPFSKESMETLREIVLKTNSKIVVISSWRTSEKGRKVLNEVLEEYSLSKYLIGYTPIDRQKREREIIQYLKTEFDEDDDIRFVILDDESSFYEKLYGHLVAINPYYGLTKKYINECINILENEKSRWK